MALAFRIIVGIFIQLVSWIAVAMIVATPVQIAWPAFAEANHTFNTTQVVTFDQAMMITRLALGGVASVAAAWIAALTLRDNRIVPMAGGLALLVFFIPNHIMLWDKFPIWYHLTFLLSLVPLTYAGNRIASIRRAAPGAAVSFP